MNWLKGPDVLLLVEIPVTVTEGENSIYGIRALQLISRLRLYSHQLLFPLSCGLIYRIDADVKLPFPRRN